MLAALENADVSWLLTLAEKLLDGRRDYIEVNPPGAIFAYIPAVWLARMLGIRLRRERRAGFSPRGRFARVGWLILGPRHADLRSNPIATTGAIAVLLVLPIYTFGEREHLCVLLILPWAAAIVARIEGRDPGHVFARLAGLGAGLCVVVKPHFILIIGMLSCALAWRARSLRPLFTLENCVAAALLALTAGSCGSSFQNSSLKRCRW